MLVTIHSVKDVAAMLQKANYGTWSKDYEACLAVAQYLEDLSEETNTPIQVDIIDLVQRFSIYKNLKDYNDTFSPSVETIEKLAEITTVIPLVNGRFIAQNF
jgi:hypothetical protein